MKEKPSSSNGAFYKQLLECGSVGLCRGTLDGLILDCNESFARILGYDSKDEVIGMNAKDLYWHPQERQGLITRLSEKGALANTELMLKKKNGTPLWTLSSCVLREVDEKESPYVEAIVVDVSERLAWEGALRNVQKRFELVTQATSDCVWDWNLADDSVWIGPAITDQFGYKTEEVKHQSEWWAQRMHSDDRQHILDSLTQAMNSKAQSWSGEYRFQRADGSFADVLDRGRILRDERGTAIRMIGAMIDVTERKRAEAALQESEERFRTAFQFAPIGKALCKSNGQYLQVNKAICEMMGYSEAELLRMTWRDLTHPDDLPVSEEVQRRLWSTDSSPLELQKRYLHKDGHVVWGLLHLSLVRDLQHTPQYAIVQLLDITEQKRMEFILQAEKQILQSIASGKALHDILHLVCRTIEVQSQGLFCSALLLDRRGSKLARGVAPTLPAEYTAAIEGLEVGPAAGSCGAAAYLGKAVVVPDIATSPLWESRRELALRHGLRACWSVPILSAEGNVLGTLATYCLETRGPFAHELLLVERASHLARIAIEQRRADEALRTLSGRLLHLQDEERRRIALELHETSAQSLTALTMNLGSLKQRRTTNGKKAKALVSDSLNLAEQCLRDLRTFSQLLYPPQLERAGLASRLRSYVRGFNKRSGIEVSISVTRGLRPLPREIESALFRLVQECLSNVHRHSGSKIAFVRLSASNGTVTLDVEDRGRGMPQRVLNDATALDEIGVGLAGMRERLRQLGGQLEILSGNKGVRVTGILHVLKGPTDENPDPSGR